MSSDATGVIVYTDHVISYFDGKKDPREERRVRKKLRTFRDHFDPTMLDDFEGYSGTSTVKKAKATRQYRAVFIWLPNAAPVRIIQVIKVFDKNRTKAPSPAFLREADENGKRLREGLETASEEEIEQLLDNLGVTTEAERPRR